MLHNAPIYYFSIADLLVCIRFQGAQLNGVHLLPSFLPFEVIPDSKSDSLTSPLLTLTVDDSLQIEKKATLVRQFDTGNGLTKLWKLSNGGYQYLMRDVQQRSCCLLQTNADFSQCRCALNGTENMRSFGLSNALMQCFSCAATPQGVMLIHASCVGYEGHAYPFTAKSGTGKSTHSGLWLQYVEGAELINDDNPVVRLIPNGRPWIYGSPWSGKTPCYRNAKGRLGAIVRIEQAPCNSIVRESPVQAFASLLPACSSMKWDEAIYENLCDAITRIVETTPIYTLSCLPDEDAALLCHQPLTRL